MPVNIELVNRAALWLTVVVGSGRKSPDIHGNIAVDIQLEDIRFGCLGRDLYKYRTENTRSRAFCDSYHWRGHLRRFYKTLIVLFLLFLGSIDAQAGRRSLRVDFGAWTEGGFAIGSADCPGTDASSSDVGWEGFGFKADPFVPHEQYLVDSYCQTAARYQDGMEVSEYLNSTTFFDDEAGLAAKVGPNTGPFPVEAIRYTYLNGDRFESETRGYQFAFYSFPNGVTLATVYGKWTSSTYIDVTINEGSQFIWNGPYDGEYFCFSNDNENGDTQFIGVWDGSASGSDPAAGCQPTALATFTMQGEGLFQSVCAPGEITDMYVDVFSQYGFSDEVLLSTVDLPTGFDVSFDYNPLSPPDYTPVYTNIDESVTAADYNFKIKGSSGDIDRFLDVQVEVVSSNPSPPSPVSPVDNATAVALTPNLSWTSVEQASSYLLELDDDPGFGSIDFSVNVFGTSVNLGDRLDVSTEYYWRVSTNTLCGVSEQSSSTSFTTVGPLILRDGFE
ncbi:hypothetical protein ACFL3I_11000 [Pseudomonadota bacterium]